MVQAQGGDAPIELKKGIRVGVEVPDGGTYVAVIERIEGRIVDVELLDDVPEGALLPDRVVNVFVPRPAGLYCWLSKVIGQSRRTALSLTMMDPVRVQQRRRHVRVDVDIPAVVRRVRGGRRGRAQNRAHRRPVGRRFEADRSGHPGHGRHRASSIPTWGRARYPSTAGWSCPTRPPTAVGSPTSPSPSDYPWIEERAGDAVSPGLSVVLPEVVRRR